MCIVQEDHAGVLSFIEWSTNALPGCPLHCNYVSFLQVIQLWHNHSESVLTFLFLFNNAWVYALGSDTSFRGWSLWHYRLTLRVGDCTLNVVPIHVLWMREKSSIEELPSWLFTIFIPGFGKYRVVCSTQACIPWGPYLGSLKLHNWITLLKQGERLFIFLWKSKTCH